MFEDVLRPGAAQVGPIVLAAVALGCGVSDEPGPRGSDADATPQTDSRLTGTDLPTSYAECIERGGYASTRLDGVGRCTFIVNSVGDALFSQCTEVGGEVVQVDSDPTEVPLQHARTVCQILYFDDGTICTGRVCR